ncbi:MAG: hypothetical protein Q8Q58_11160 [Candidatus Rokubacteria bacterium]|nr:hypothetical protein [Candidatus Rokubacteria bacterium]
MVRALVGLGLLVAVVAGAEAEQRRIVREAALGCRSLDYLGQMVKAMAGPG